MRKSKNLTAAIEAHNDLNIFSAVVGLLESGCVYTSRGKKTAAKIIAICEAAAQSQLRSYDDAMALLDEAQDGD